MKTTLVSILVAEAIVFSACGGSDNVKRGQQQYDVVQEGATTATTTAASPVPLTATNVDTTSNFTLDPNAVSANPIQQPNVIAGTLPSTGSLISEVRSVRETFVPRSNQASL